MVDDLDDSSASVALNAFCAHLTSDAVAYLQSCVHCGLCAETCHYFLANGEAENIPAHKLNLVSSVYRKHLTPAGKLPRWLTGAAPLDDEMIDAWVDALFGRCTLCGRCSLNCTNGINIARMIRLGRSSLAAAGLVPSELQATVAAALATGNNMGIPREDWIETIRWIEEELQMEVGDSEARIPVDKEGADLLYTVNPREPKFFPLSLLAAAKIFYAAGANWTVAGDYYDVTNYGLFSGDNNAARIISEHHRSTMQRLGVRTLVLGECGHGFAANRWDAPEWQKAEDRFEIKSMVELLAEYLRARKITLDPTRIKKTVTLHDPCNLARSGGIIEEPRFVLHRAVSSFIEMTPNREQNFCCGGGGGQLSMTRFAQRRLEAGIVKAEQIKRTGAQIVVAPCHNCIDQLSELNRHYKLGVEVKTLSEVVAEALVIEREPSPPADKTTPQ